MSQQGFILLSELLTDILLVQTISEKHMWCWYACENVWLFFIQTTGAIGQQGAFFPSKLYKGEQISVSQKYLKRIEG